MILQPSTLPEHLLNIVDFDYSLMTKGDYIAIQNHIEHNKIMIDLAIDLAERDGVLLYDMGKDENSGITHLLCMKNLNEASMSDIDTLDSFIVSKNNKAKKSDLTKKFGSKKVNEFINTGIIKEVSIDVVNKKQGRPCKFYGLAKVAHDDIAIKYTDITNETDNGFNEELMNSLIDKDDRGETLTTDERNQLNDYIAFLQYGQ